MSRIRRFMRRPSRAAQEFPFLGRVPRMTPEEVEWWERWLFWGGHYLGRDVVFGVASTEEEEAEAAAQGLMDGEDPAEEEED